MGAARGLARAASAGDRRRIVFVCNALRVGGSQTVLLELVRTAVGAGFEAVVASRGGEMEAEFRSAGARVVRLMVREGTAEPSGRRASRAAKTIASFAGAVQLVALTARSRALIQASQPWPTGIAALASCVTRRPLVWHAHGTTAVEQPPAFPRAVRRASAAWVGITHEVAAAVAAVAPGPRTRVLTLANPIRVQAAGSEPAPTHGAVAIGVMSTLTANKRGYVEACIAAAAGLARPDRPIDVLVVGDGHERTSLEQAADRFAADVPGLRVVFLGASLDPWRLLARCRAIVGMGLVALEAAAAGHAVVCASSDGFGGVLTPRTYPALAATNFTGRGLELLSVAALRGALASALESGPDPELARIVRELHVDGARAAWIALWSDLL